MGFGLKKEVTANVTPSTIVYFDKVTPTTVGVIFDPNTPATTDTLYVSSVDASTWIWNGSAYVSYTAPTTSSTEWYLNGTTIDAGSNKTAAIQRSGAIYVSADSYFNGVRVGRGGGNNAVNLAVGYDVFVNNVSGIYNVALGKNAGYRNTTGSQNVFLGFNSGIENLTGSNNSFLGGDSGRYIADGVGVNSASQNSIFIGLGSKALANNNTNQIVIGYNAIGKGSNTVQIGNTSITNTYLQGAVTFNNAFTLPTTDGTSAQALTTNGSGVVSWTTISSAIPQAQVIYVDSVNGVNSATGRGNINTPYLTPEYALSNITNTATFTGNTATNTTISAISDVNNALLEVGMYVSGSGIPFETIIVAKGNQGSNANTVTLSRATTATATGVTVTWRKIYEVRLNGSFIVASNLFKEGFYINSQTARISWSNFNLFDLTTVVLTTPYYILGNGNYFGTHISSVFINGSGTQTSGFAVSISFGDIETISTTYTFNITLTNAIIQIRGVYVNARFGYVGNFSAGGFDIDFTSYGLLGGLGFSTGNSSSILSGSHTTPASVSVLSAGYYTQSTASLNGSTSWSGYSSHRGYLKGTNHSVAQSDITVLNRGGGTITCTGGTSNITTSDSVNSVTINVNSGCACNVYGYDVTLASITGTLNMYGQTNSNSTISGGAGVINNYGYIYVVSMGSFTGTFNNWGAVSAGSFGGGASVNNYGSVTVIYYGINVSSSKTFLNRGVIISNGALLNSNAVVTLTNATSVFDNYGSITNNDTDITKAVIEKTAGTLYLRQGSYLKVANAKSPIKCTANTSASKDIYSFGTTDNCNGSTYGLTFAFDGSSFAPNNLVTGSTLYENVNY